MMRSINFRRLIPLLFFFCSYSGFGQNAQQGVDSSVKFEVSSVRFMNDEERARKAGDDLDPDVVMKCRIVNQGKVTIYLATDFINTIAPTGHLVKRTDKGLVWVLDSSGKESSTSPGFKPLSSGSWLTLFEGDAVEWEPVQASGQLEETRAITVFMKFGGEDKKIVEVFSNFYKIPAKKTE